MSSCTETLKWLRSACTVTAEGLLLSFQLATETSISRTNSLSWNPRAVMAPWQLESIESSLRLLFQHMEDINTVNINKLQITFHNLYRTSKGVSTFQAAQICRAPLGAK